MKSWHQYGNTVEKALLPSFYNSLFKKEMPWGNIVWFHLTPNLGILQFLRNTPDMNTPLDLLMYMCIWWHVLCYHSPMVSGAWVVKVRDLWGIPIWFPGTYIYPRPEFHPSVCNTFLDFLGFPPIITLIDMHYSTV